MPTLRSYPEWRDTYSQIEQTGEVASQEKRKAIARQLLQTPPQER